jgi:hypothetical protein
LRLERLDGRARLTVYGVTGAESPAEAAARPGPAPGFALRFSPGGALAQLWVARSILAAHGGAVRTNGPTASSGAEDLTGYEVELEVSGNSSTGTRD